MCTKTPQRLNQAALVLALSLIVPPVGLQAQVGDRCRRAITTEVVGYTPAPDSSPAYLAVVAFTDSVLVTLAASGRNDARWAWIAPIDSAAAALRAVGGGTQQGALVRQLGLALRGLAGGYREDETILAARLYRALDLPSDEPARLLRSTRTPVGSRVAAALALFHSDLDSIAAEGVIASLCLLGAHATSVATVMGLTGQNVASIAFSALPDDQGDLFGRLMFIGGDRLGRFGLSGLRDIIPAGSPLAFEIQRVSPRLW